MSYQGGSGGDMIAASLNDISIVMNSHNWVANKDFSLKRFEPFDNVADLIKIAQSQSFAYLSTHALSLLDQYPGKVINLVVTDPGTRRTIVLRQMHLQTLKIQVDDHSTWFKIVKTYCKKNNFLAAAKYWFTRAESIWNNDMDHRLDTHRDHVQNVSIDTVFTTDFVSDLSAQIHVPNLDRLRSNHINWLDRNHPAKWTLDSTLESMCQKLAQMRWGQRSGVVRFSQC